MGYKEEKQRQLDRRYLRMARIWAENSYCVRRKVGALIVKDKMIISDGYNGIEIIRYYYGNDMYINTAEQISGIPSSWPGADLTVGSTGSKVRQMQEQLNRIAQAYPALPTITADGIFGEKTRQAVADFQRIFGLPVTGIVDYPTWFKISDIYVGVSRIAELQ